ncbi:protein-tyrosine kinase 6b [Trichomycterus rosablanca]|uniref:protein-tyrosine kinase 6b n=1 Tax=Trichomycterus rosablanca TaxID=2290929 RepID=UPI002F34FFA0
MEDCLRKSCPCLRSLWDRMFGGAGTGGLTVKNVNATDSAENSEKRYHTCKPLPQIPQSEAPSSSSNPSPVYVALWAFEARDNAELSFEEGDRFLILQRNGQWWTAEKLNKTGQVIDTGIVPYNYIERADSISSQPWFFGKMNRIECLSQLLADQNRDGAFLVRVSESDNVDHVLSVKVNNKAKHFKIYLRGSEYYVEQSLYFPSLVELIQHYQSHPLASVDRLRKPCVRREPQPQDLSHNTVDEWELPKEDFTLEHKLGSGYFADVYRGKWKNSTSVAIKVLKNNESLDQREFQLEVEVLKRLRHDHLISLFAICTSSTPYYIITEYMDKGNLLDLLRGQDGRALDSEILIDMAYQVADGMTYLEAQNSIHRDLAARNVLVSEGYFCKVADFGLARFIKEPVYISNEKNIPYKWSAPEAILHGHFSNKSDVWSFGVLLYEIFSYGAIPYPGLSSSAAVKQVTQHAYRMPAPAKCPVFIDNLMTSCWKEKPEDRPDFKSLKSDLLVTINRYITLN